MDGWIERGRREEKAHQGRMRQLMLDAGLRLDHTTSGAYRSIAGEHKGGGRSEGVKSDHTSLQIATTTEAFLPPLVSDPSSVYSTW